MTDDALEWFDDVHELDRDFSRYDMMRAFDAGKKLINDRVQVVLDSLLAGLSDREPDHGDYEISGRWVFDMLTGKRDSDG